MIEIEKASWLRKHKTKETTEKWLALHPEQFGVMLFYVFPDAEDISPPEQLKMPWDKWR